MRRELMLCLVITFGSTLAAAPPERHVILGEAALIDGLPSDLTDPEGRSRWDLSGLELTRSFELRDTREETGAAIRSNDSGRSVRYTDPAGGDAAERWLFPQNYGAMLRPGASETLVVDEHIGENVSRLKLKIDTVGIGWVHLPAKPHEVALQRVLVQRELPSGRGFAPESLAHRWVDPRAGIVAEIAGPASRDGLERLAADEVTVAQQFLGPVDFLRVYLPELDTGPFDTLTFRRDRGATNVPDLIANNAGVTTIMDLVNLGVWDFDIAANRTGTPIAQHSVVANDFETCNIGQPGYFAGMTMGRRDINYGTTSLLTDNDITEIILGDEGDPANDPAMIWMRGGRQKEGVSGAFGSGETGFEYTDKRICMGDEATLCRDAQDCIDAGTTGPCDQRCENDTTVSCSSNADCPSNTACVATPVPLWRFPNFDGEWYLKFGDPAWSSAPFACEQNFVNGVCGAGGIGAELYSKDCGDYSGTQSGGIIAEGVATLPSGHTVNAVVVRTLAELCVYPFAGCGIFPTQVRTAVYLWQVPHLNTVALLQSIQNVPDENTIDNFDQAQFATDLFPPVTITAGNETDDSIDVSWVPSTGTLGVTDYVVYWDTDSGSVSDYMNSTIVPSTQTSTTITGLNAGTQYFITVTARSNFSPYPAVPFCRRDYTIACADDTACGSDGPCVTSQPAPTLYESIRFPTTISGDPDNVYPIEVMATTAGGTCIPTEEVTGLTFAKLGAGVCELCWDASGDPCLAGYEVVAGNIPTPPGTVIDTTGPGVTCWSGSPTEDSFRVRVLGTGGSGP